MIIEFPHGHAYDFERLCAGMTALLGRDPSNKGSEQWTWERAITPAVTLAIPAHIAGSFSSGTTPPYLMPSRKVFFATCSSSSTGELSPDSVRVSKFFSGIMVHIPMGCDDPINEVIGFWRYGQPATLNAFELK